MRKMTLNFIEHDRRSGLYLSWAPSGHVTGPTSVTAFTVCKYVFVQPQKSNKKKYVILREKPPITYDQSSARFGLSEPL